jgi:hypothetical protein
VDTHIQRLNFDMLKTSGALLLNRASLQFPLNRQCNFRSMDKIIDSKEIDES